VRTFAAVVPPFPVAEELDGLRQRLAVRLPGLRWVAPANLHFTMRFFGDLTGEEVARVGEVADAVAAEAVPFPVELQGLGVFPGWGRPRVLWAGCGRGAPVLEAMARTFERRLRAVGLGEADKPFVAHLTLGRWRDASAVRGEDLRHLCEEETVPGRFQVGELRILQSVLGSGGATYSLLHAAALGRAR